MTDHQNVSKCEDSDEGVRHTTVTPLLDLDNWVGDKKRSPCGNYIFHQIDPTKFGLYGRNYPFMHCEDRKDRVGADKIQLIKNLLNEHPFLATPLYTILFIGEK